MIDDEDFSDYDDDIDWDSDLGDIFEDLDLGEWSDFWDYIDAEYEEYEGAFDEFSKLS